MRSLLPLAFLCSAAYGYKWDQVKIGGGGGFTPGIVFNPTEKGVAYARTDIGGLYRLNGDDSWTPLQDYVNGTNWNEWGVSSVATDPIDPANVYITIGMYLNEWDPNLGAVLRSSNYGETWEKTALPFKMPGNCPGRGMGERMAVDPQNNKIIYFGAPAGHGLFRSVDKGVIFSNVSSFHAVGTYAPDPTDTYGYYSQFIGVTCVLFDTTSGKINGATSIIYIATADVVGPSVWVSKDAGMTWSAVPDQPMGFFPHRMKFSAAKKALYLSYNNVAGPYDNGNGSVWRYATSGTWKNITPAWSTGLTMGYGGLTLDAKVPGTLMVASDNLWIPDAQIFRSTDSGSTWKTLWDTKGPKNLVNMTEDVKYYTEDTNKAPWIDNQRIWTKDTKILGWMIAALEIDPHDSNHWLYGTGLTLYGGHDLTKFPSVHVQALADGIEETSVRALTCPPGGPPLISGVADECGFKHDDLHVSPNNAMGNPYVLTTQMGGIDYAGLHPSAIVRIGNSGSSGHSQLGISMDGGSTWTPGNVPSTDSSGSIAISADSKTIIWLTGNGNNYALANGVLANITSLPTGLHVASDKVHPAFVYAVSSSTFYSSSDSGYHFNATTPLNSTAVNAIRVHPAVAGDIWVGGTNGLFHSTDFGHTFAKISSVTTVYDLVLGKGDQSKDYPKIYAFVSVNGGQTVLSVSADKGVTWMAIADAKHGFGDPTVNVLAASWDVPGRVFVGTNGRGIFYGMP